MRRLERLCLLLLTALLVPMTANAQWGAPTSPVIPDASGYIVVPNAAMMPTLSQKYRAIYNATQLADAPNHLVPALDMVGSELNLLGAMGMPLSNAKFVVVFHGPAMDAIMNDDTYQAKYGVPNPNLKTIADLKKAGVELFVCGQNLAFENISPKTLTPDVKIAVDALIVLMAYQNNGYALLNY